MKLVSCAASAAASTSASVAEVLPYRMLKRSVSLKRTLSASERGGEQGNEASEAARNQGSGRLASIFMQARCTRCGRVDVRLEWSQCTS